MKRMGVDLGGTKIEAAVLDTSGEILLRRRVPTPQGDYAGTVEALASLVEQLESEAGERCTVGVGTPGTVSPATGLIKNANSVVLNDRPLKQDLERRLGRTIAMANDANCFALSEAVDGAARGAGTVFGVIIGTGVGGGVVVDGKVLTGPNAIAGEWGHNPLPWMDDDEHPGRPCWCGLAGCIETWLSGPAFERDYAARSGSRRPAPEIVERAGSGDPVAMTVLRDYESRLARALAQVINLLDPDAIVLGGGMSNVESLYAQVPQQWDRWVFSDRVDGVRLLQPAHGDSSGVRGAAWLAADPEGF
ncbi:MAG: ROK family protein [Halothiobacillaceae bacterium]